MGAYESFARVYDLFMDNVPYEEWGSYLLLNCLIRRVFQTRAKEIG